MFVVFTSSADWNMTTVAVTIVAVTIVAVTIVAVTIVAVTRVSNRCGKLEAQFVNRHASVGI